MRVPREKPLPKPKEPTRWELLAKRKGIKSVKKDKLVYSEAHDEFRTRYGFKSKNEGEDMRNWIVPAKPSDGNKEFIHSF
jgi:regulator of ribosome biosynthesis